MRTRNILLGLMLATAVTGTANAEDKAGDKPVDPRVAAWVDHKPGTVLRMSGTVLVGPRKGAVELLFALKEVGDDKKSVVVEVAGAMAIAGQQQQMPASEEKYPPTKDKIKVQSLEPTDIDVGDKTYACKVYKITTTNDKNEEVQETVYISKDVPGFAKIEHVEKEMKIIATVKSVEEK